MADSETTNTPEAAPATIASEPTPANPTPAAPSAEAPSAASSTSAGATETTIELLKDNLQRQIDAVEERFAKTGKLLYKDAATNIKNLIKEIEVLGGKVEVDIEALFAKWF